MIAIIIHTMSINSVLFFNLTTFFSQRSSAGIQFYEIVWCTSWLVANLAPGINITLSSHHPLSTLHPAFEDGTDRGFRNVGKSQSDAGEIPKRIQTIFKTRRKFEIKNYMRCVGTRNIHTTFITFSATRIIIIHLVVCDWPQHVGRLIMSLPLTPNSVF
jgi:hypothetical protein